MSKPVQSLDTPPAVTPYDTVCEDPLASPQLPVHDYIKILNVPIYDLHDRDQGRNKAVRGGLPHTLSAVSAVIPATLMIFDLFKLSN
jgi:hypothetical protein